MKNLKLLKVCIYSFVFSCILSACGLGSYEPENKGALLSPDGTKIVQLYSVFFCTNYRQEGGVIQRSGSTTFYINIFDASNGKNVNKTPYKFNKNLKLDAITNKSILVSEYNNAKNRFSLIILDINSGKIKFNESKLSKINNGLIFNPKDIFPHEGSNDLILIKADDARLYFLNENTGKASLAPEEALNHELINKTDFDGKSYANFDSLTLSFEGSNRKKLLANTRTEVEVSDTLTRNNKIKVYHRKVYQENKKMSDKDYINPCLVTIDKLKKDEFKNDFTVVRPLGDLLILSKTKDSNNFEWSFSLLGEKDLSEKWTLQLKNPLIDQKAEYIKNIHVVDNSLIVITDQSANRLDLQKGKWAWNLRFVKSFEK